jgi:DNA polymerase II large subunit
MAYLKTKETVFLQNIKKRIGCDKGDCGTYFNLESCRIVFVGSKERRIKYSGKCSRCQKHLVLKGTELDRFIKAMGIPTIKFTNYTLNQFFVEK